MKLFRDKSVPCRTFRSLIKQIFSKLSTDYNSGWDKGYSELSAIDHVAEITSNVSAKSELFGRYNHFALDIIQSLIKYPLQKEKYK